MATIYIFLVSKHETRKIYLWCALKDSGVFQAFFYASSVEKGGMKDLSNYVSENLKELSSHERLIVNIILSMEDKELFKMADLTIIQKFFSTLQIPVLWGLDTNENLASDEFAINVIASN